MGSDYAPSLIQAICLNPLVISPALLALCLLSGAPTTLTATSSIFFIASAALALTNFLNDKIENNWTDDTYNWKDELVVVTGGSSGIGAAIVAELSRHHIQTVILDIQPPQETAATKARQAPGTPPHFRKCDLSRPAEIEAACASIRAAYGSPTILINNAGLWNRAPLLHTAAEQTARLFAINVTSQFDLIGRLLPAMVEKNHGMVVTTTSVAAYGASPAGMVDYAASKAALVALHEGLGAELVAKYQALKVRTVLVVPNFVNTPMAQGIVYSSPSPMLEPEQVATRVVQHILKGRSGTVIVPESAFWLGMTIRVWPRWLQRSFLLGQFMTDITKDVGTKGGKARDEA